jgi:beta-galactosidase
MRFASPAMILSILAAITSPLDAGEVSPRSRESFNGGWRFARFGPMPDGSRRPEPGAERWSIQTSASSEELAKGNMAEHAIDGNSETRWCPAGPGTSEWLTLDLGSGRSASGIEVDWEFPDLEYAYAVDGSTDGRTWNALASGSSRDASKRLSLARTARVLRVRPLRLPEVKWASIREVRLFDTDGRPIANSRLPGGDSPATLDFDDSVWRTLDVPHDWGIEGPFRDDLPGDTGKLPWKGIGWYRKHFTLPDNDRGKRVFIDFDGAMANARVWLNGREVGGWPYGYQSFRVELTPHVKFGSDNVLAVRLDTASWGSRWYPGAGLYRNVWLVKTSPVHVTHWGVYVTTPSIGGEEGTVKLAITVENQLKQEVTVVVRPEIYELGHDGMVGSKAAGPEAKLLAITAGRQGFLELTATVPGQGDGTSPRRSFTRRASASARTAGWRISTSSHLASVRSSSRRVTDSSSTGSASS